MNAHGREPTTTAAKGGRCIGVGLKAKRAHGWAEDPWPPPSVGRSPYSTLGPSLSSEVST
eukprot:2136690-Prymnesium_polylepis.1